MHSEQIRQWMQEHELTHQQVADQTGYARVSVTRALGAERVSERFWRRFCAAFPEAALELAEGTGEQVLEQRR